MNATLEQIANRIKKAKSVVIFTHMRPDGDAFGSALSLSSALCDLGIRNGVCVETDIPSNLAFIPEIERVKKLPDGEFDLLVCVDCSNVQRLGALSDEFLTATRKIWRVLWYACLKAPTPQSNLKTFTSNTIVRFTAMR